MFFEKERLPIVQEMILAKTVEVRARAHTHTTRTWHYFVIAPCMCSDGGWSMVGGDDSILSGATKCSGPIVTLPTQGFHRPVHRDERVAVLLLQCHVCGVWCVVCGVWLWLA